jgi:hypothetical protein
MTETPIVISQPYVPFELDIMEYTPILELIGYDRNTEVKKVEVWDRLSFILSMAGLVLMPNNVRTIKHTDKLIVFTLQDNTRMKIGYDTLISFDKHVDEKLKVYDWFSIRSGSKVELEEINEEAGLRGKPNGYNSKGKMQYYAIKIEHSHREIHKSYKPKHTVEEIYNKFNTEKELWNLSKKLLHRKEISTLRESSRLQVVV